MVYGPPTPISSPLDQIEQPERDKTGSRENDPLKEEKKRRSHVVRVWGQGEGNEQFWVDLEVIDRATFSGSTFPGFFGGNQPADTILYLDHTPGMAGNRERSFAKVSMDPTKKTEDHVMVPVIETCLLVIQRGEKLERRFINGRENSTTDSDEKMGKRIQAGVQITSNNIDEDFLSEPAEGTGSKDQKAPPSDPKKYIEAVRKSDSEASLYLNVYIPFGFWMKQAKTHRWQGKNFVRLWGNKISTKLPGTNPSEKDAEHIVIDPYSAIINFGPDTLAVEFHEGAGPAADKPPGEGGAAPPATGGGATL